MNNDEKRIYSEVFDVNEKSVSAFFDKRAKDFDSGIKNDNTAVLFGDSKPGYADKWDEFEKNKILPSLRLDKSKNVIDIGCGVGRWATSVVPLCGRYVGVDFSEEMIKAVSKRFADKDNVLFKRASFLDLFEDVEITGKKYDAVIITGVSIYINDSILAKCYEKLPDILNKGAIVYIEESIGVETRLTLNGVWSEDMKSNYAAIYRTRDEYLELLSPVITKANVLVDDYFQVLDKKEFSETSHWYTLLEMK